MRKMQRALMVHKDHVSAVYVCFASILSIPTPRNLTETVYHHISMDVAYSPTGREFVSGSYDRTIRIFGINSAKSREVYHAKRMQRIFSVKFSADSNFVLSGSDDTNIRIWKAEANKKVGTTAPRERRKLEYNDSLKERYQHLREISRISKYVLLLSVFGVLTWRSV